MFIFGCWGILKWDTLLKVSVLWFGVGCCRSVLVFCCLGFGGILCCWFFFLNPISQVSIDTVFPLTLLKTFLSFVWFVCLAESGVLYITSQFCFRFCLILGRKCASKSQGLLEVIRAPNLWLITTVQCKMLRQTALVAAGINSETWRRAVSILPPWWVQLLCLWHKKQCAF